MLAVIGLYWVQLTIFQAFAALASLGLISILVGTFGLRGVHDKK
jgi:hypothetical protein